MAEPLGILGAISASVDLAERIIKYFDEFRNAPDHAAELISEVVAVCHVLGILRSRLLTAGAAYDRTSVLFFAVDGCQARLKDVHDVLEPILSAQSRIRKFWARLKWPLEKESAVEIVLALHRYVQIFHFAVGLDGLDALSKFQCEALEDIQKRLTSMEESQAARAGTMLQETLAAIRSLPDMSADVGKLRTDLEKVVLDKESAQRLETVPALPYQARHRDLQLRRMDGVGLWVLDTPQFRSWRDGTSKSNILWLNGGPGVGKTYISSGIIDHLTRFGTETPHVTLFFYFEYKRQAEEDPLKVLQTLFHQLLVKSRSTSADVSGMLSRAARQKELLSWDELKAAFVGQCNASGGTVYLVLDALDECDERTNRAPMIRLLDELKKCSARILITSRQFAPDIDRLLSDCDTITIEAAASDVRAYLVDHIARSPRAARLMDEALKERVIGDILSKSQGMFLLPALQIAHILGQTNKQEILRALQSLPIGLKANFDLTLVRIQSQDAQSKTRANLGLSVLMWLSHAKQPFKDHELQHAVAINLENGTMNDLTSADFFVDCCFGLVVKDQDTNIIRLVHQSVNEYLQSNQESLFPDGHAIIARSCLWYYLQNGPRSAAQASVWRTTMPFLPYAAAFLMVHATDVAAQDVMVPEIRRAFAGSESINRWIEVLHLCTYLDFLDLDNVWLIDRPITMVNHGSTLLHVAIVFGAKTLVEDILKDAEMGLNTPDSAGITPLMAAAAWGRGFALGPLLARHDLEVNLADGQGRTALDWAVKMGQDAAVEALLGSAHAVNISMEGPGASSIERLMLDPSQRGIMRLCLAYRHLDLRLSAVQITKDYNVLWCKVACLWDPPTLQALLERPDFDPWLWGSPRSAVLVLLDEAVRLEYSIDLPAEWKISLVDVEMQRRRINRLASVPSILCSLDADARFDIPPLSVLGMLWPFVYYAFCQDLPPSSSTTPDRVEYCFRWMTIRDTVSGSLRDEFRAALQSRNVTFSFHDSAGRGFMHYIAWLGDEKLFDFLLGLGPSWIAEEALRPDNHGKTPLHFAAEEGREYIVRALLHLDADMFATDMDGWTALHYAVESGHVSTVRLLLSRGADRQIHQLLDNKGMSVLHLASRSANSEVVIGLLLSLGLDIDARNNIGSTPLHRAVTCGAERAVRLLLENGADPDAKSVLGVTTLCYATHFGGPYALLLLGRSAMSVSDLDVFGDNILETLYDTSNYAKTPPLALSQPRSGASPAKDEERKYRHRVKLVLTALRLLLSLGTKALPDLAYTLATILSRHGDKIPAQILLETYADERSKAARQPHFKADSRYQMECVACETNRGYLFRCETCYRVILCSRCRVAPPPSVLKPATLRSCAQHRFMQFPRGEWSSIPKGFVTTDGLTLVEWLRELEAKYSARCASLGIEPDPMVGLPKNPAVGH